VHAGLEIFAYLDYRAFLRDHYASRKERGYSYRVFSRRAGLRSPNYLKLVIDGERNLSAAMIGRFAAACGLTGTRRRYFEQLVRFDQARTLDARERAYTAIRRMRGTQRGGSLEGALDAYHSLWYLPAIRELVTSTAFREDARWIAAQLLPPIRTTEARAALRTLERLGMVVRDADGRLRQATPTVTTGPEVRSRQIAEFHGMMIEHGKSAMVRLPARERDISALTLCLSEHGLGLLKKAVQRFRRELMELAELEQSPRQVVQLNFQLFPLTRTEVEP
jgi:uncharacterized protein (TIGR02147 family)